MVENVVMSSDGQAAFRLEYLGGQEGLNYHVADVVENLYRHDQLHALDNIAPLRPKFDQIVGWYDTILTPSVDEKQSLRYCDSMPTIKTTISSNLKRHPVT